MDGYRGLALAFLATRRLLLARRRPLLRIPSAANRVWKNFKQLASAGAELHMV